MDLRQKRGTAPNMCVCGKMSYSTRAEARKVARKMKAHPAHREKGYVTRPMGYLCPLCGRFHVGHRRVIQKARSI